MGKGVEALALAGLFLLLFPLICVLSGTIVYFVWPVAVPAAFPGLVASGTLAASISWWQAVCLTWLIGCFMPSRVQSNNK